MEAKDTVMAEGDMARLWHEYCTNTPLSDKMSYPRSIAQAQAEISFRAGREQERNDSYGYMLKVRDDEHKAGIREVVEWIKEVAGYDRFQATDGKKYGCVTIIEDCWQVKLNEWGVNEEVSDNIC